LFTALGSEYFSLDLDQPMAALPLVVYKYATGPYPEWHQLAWTASLVLIVVVLVLSVAARIVTAQRFGRR
jgi:phosphate transport system permease protein